MKPQVIESVLTELKGHIDDHHVVISIAAGISDTYIKATLDFDCKVVLVMPNTPLLIDAVHLPWLKFHRLRILNFSLSSIFFLP